MACNTKRNVERDRLVTLGCKRYMLLLILNLLSSTYTNSRIRHQCQCWVRAYGDAGSTDTAPEVNALYEIAFATGGRAAIKDPTRVYWDQGKSADRARRRSATPINGHRKGCCAGPRSALQF